MTTTQDTVVQLEWSRGRGAQDFTDEKKLRMNGDKKQAQSCEVIIAHTFRKKTTVYFDKD